MKRQAIQVLLVTSDGALGTSVRAALEERVSCSLLHVREVPEAIQKLTQELLDVVLLDCPEQGCIQGLRQICSHAGGLPILILLRAKDEGLGLEYLQEGASALVNRDSLVPQLSWAIQATIETKIRTRLQRMRSGTGLTLDSGAPVTASAGERVFSISTERDARQIVATGLACEAVTGYSAQEFAADSSLWSRRLIHEVDAARFNAWLERVLSGELVDPLEHRIVHKDGSVRWVKTALAARPSATEQPAGTEGFVTDVTEQRLAQSRIATQWAVTQVLAEATTLSEATVKLLEAICQNLGWDFGAFWRIVNHSEQLRCVAIWQQPWPKHAEFNSITSTYSFPRGVGLPGRIWASGQPAWIANVAEDLNFPRAQVANKAGLHAGFGFPVTLGSKTLGVMEFFSRDIQQPDYELLRMVTTVGCQFGQFIERKRTEEALAEERNLLRTLIDALPDATYVKDAESRFLIGNLGVARLMGAPDPEQLVGKRDFDFYPADLADRYYADERLIIQSGEALINREEPAIDAAGKQHWLLTTKVPLRDSSGRVVGLVGIGRDITELKRVEGERDRFFTLSLDMLCIAGFDGFFKQLNPAWERTLGFTKEELMARPYLDFVHPEDREMTSREAEKLARGWQTVTFENRYLCKDGSYKWLLWSSCPFAEQQMVYAAARDITQRKQYEAQLRQANSELSRSEEALRAALADVKKSHRELKSAQLQLIQTAKLESVGTLAAGVAHEVKNPLQIILMGVDFLSRNVDANNQDLCAVLDDMRHAIARADRIVRGLLEFSAAYRPDVQDEDLNTIIEASLALVKFELTKSHIEVKRVLGDNLPRLKLDKTKIQQVFINIFMNAIHSMSQGGTLTVGTYIRRLTEIEHDVGDRSVGQLRVGDTVDFKVGEIAVVAEVEDTGAGIPEDQLTKIFDPFFTTKSGGKGTGLGLTVVKKIVELHGGTIDLRNRPEGGVIVTIIFKTWRT